MKFLAALAVIALASCGGKTVSPDTTPGASLPDPGSPACTSTAGSCILCSDERWRCAGHDDAGIAACAPGTTCASGITCVSCAGGTGILCNNALNPGGDNDVEITMTPVACSQ